MDITPQDLGEKWRKDLLKRRAVIRIRQRMGHIGTNGETTYARGKRVPRTRLARFWLKPANLPEKDAAEIIPLLTYPNTGVSIWRNVATTFSCSFFFWFAAMLIFTFISNSAGYYSLQQGYLVLSLVSSAAWIAWAMQTTLIVPRNALRHINTDTVTIEEIEAFLPTVRGELDRAYLNTVLETLRQPLPVVAGQDIRATLRAVGDVVSALPGETITPGRDDAAVLRASALDKRQRADQEPDSLLQESLRRQAEAEEKQAQMIERSGTAVKRARARQEEALGQINTLRTVLTVYASPVHAARLEQSTDLQDRVRHIAGDAIAAADAKRELDDSQLVALYGNPLPEPQVQAVGLPGNPATSGSTTDKWWQRTNGNG